MSRRSPVVALSLLSLSFVPYPASALDAAGIAQKYAQFLPPAIEKPSPERTRFLREADGIIGRLRKIAGKIKGRGPYSLKIATLAPEGTAWVDVTRDLVIPIVKDISDGALDVSLYPGGVMGEDKDILRKMRLGQLQGCGCTAQGLITVVPELAVFSLPFLFRNYDEVDYILTRYRREIDSLFKKKGLFVFSLLDTGYFYLFLKEKADTLDELRKQKFVTWFGDVEISFLNALGIQPIPIAVPEVVPSLRSGMVNADIAPPAWFLGAQAYLSTRYFIEPPFFYSIAAIVLDDDALTKESARVGLTKKDTDEVMNLTVRMMKLIGLEKLWNARLRAYERQCMSGFVDDGLKPIRLEGDGLRPIEQAGRRVWDELAGKEYPRALLDKILKALDKYRKEERSPR